MLTISEGKKAVYFARNVIEQYVKNKKNFDINLSGLFLENQGAFVTIHSYPNHDLRGCIGIIQPVMTLKEAIIEGAKSATRDPRFSPIKEGELDKIVIEVTILTKPVLICVSEPMDYLKEIEIGRDGLIVENGFYKGLLLPQVPVEQNWDIEDFLCNTCIKAGIMPDAWFDKKTKIFKFSGQVFTEVKPRGEIEEKKLNESCS
jgi:uncharacterized protein (TIGR00296 family)